MSCELLDLITNSSRLERDRGVEQLQQLSLGFTNREKLEFELSLVRIVNQVNAPWESKWGCLTAGKVLTEYANMEKEDDANFVEVMIPYSQQMLYDEEERVRLIASQLIGTLCKKLGVKVYEDCKDFLLSSIENCLKVQYTNDDDHVGLVSNAKVGLRYLESYLRCLQEVIDGCGVSFQPYVDEELMGNIFCLLTHKNRFVKEAGFYTCANLITCGDSSQDVESRDSVSAVNPVFAFAPQICKYITLGLSDYWAEVRLAASIAVRKFLKSFRDPTIKEVYYYALIPRMCLNRYDGAHGVQKYSQDTWQEVIGSEGIPLVEKYLNEIVEYYTEAITSKNVHIREAACSCLAEVANKLEDGVVQPHAKRLIHTLFRCSEDDSWIVRDVACEASGNFIINFPEECHDAISSLYPMYFRNLQDPVVQVRRSAAAALAKVVLVYHEDALNTIMMHVNATFLKLKRSHHSQMGPKKPGVLSPEMQQSSSSVKQGSRQPWELAQGCVVLLTMLSTNPEAKEAVQSALPLVADAANQHYYTEHAAFVETVCNELPNLARGIRKQNFNNFLDNFFDSIFYALRSEHFPASCAAKYCLVQLRIIYGQDVLHAKVQQYNEMYLDDLSSI